MGRYDLGISQKWRLAIEGWGLGFFGDEPVTIAGFLLLNICWDFKPAKLIGNYDKPYMVRKHENQTIDSTLTSERKSTDQG